MVKPCVLNKRDMAKTFWDKYEVALLIESCLRIRSGEVSRATELYSLSEKLRRMATIKCINIDDVYRNINGIRWQLGIIEAVFDGKEFESRQHPQLFIEMVRLYQHDKNRFDEILKEAHQMLATPIYHVHKKEKTHTTKTVYEFESLDQKKSLAEVFDVDASLFCAVPVDSLDLSVRASNCLEKAKCLTVEQLLSYSVSQLQCVRNLGARSLDEIIKKVKSITSTSMAETHRASVLRSTTSKYKIDIHSNTEFGEKIEAILAGQPIEIANDEEKTVVEQINSAIDEVGVELCSTTYSNPKYGKTICDMLWKFAFPEISKQQAWKLVVEKINALPQAKRDVLALPYIYVYEAQRKRPLGIIKELCNATTTVGQIRFFKTHILTSEDGEVCLGELPSFFDWVSTDFRAEMDSIMESLKSSLSQKTTIAIDILHDREHGVTLEELGEKYGLTRERIRQKEKKAVDKFWRAYNHQSNDLVMLIYALRCGDTVLYFDEIKNEIGEFAYILWTALKNNPSHANFHFSKKANAVVIRQFDERTSIDEQLNVKIDALSNLFPTIVHESEKDALIERLSDEADLPTEIVEVQFDGHYRRSGQFYHRGNLTITFMCDFVLKQEFRDGYKIASPEFAEAFKEQLYRYFDKDPESITDRALDAKISDVGILIGRGKYIHRDYLNVPLEIIEQIYEYLKECPYNTLTYIELFDALKSIFVGTQITDRYSLQGALQKYGCPFATNRDRIIKVPEANLISYKVECPHQLRQILVQKFPYGIRPESSIDLIKLRGFADALGIELNLNDALLTLQIESEGIEFDGKLYFYPEETVKEIVGCARNILETDTGVVYYSVLFDKYFEWFDEHHISSPDHLKEVLRHAMSGAHFNRNFMHKYMEQITEVEAVERELERVWGNDVTHTYDELYSLLPYIPPEQIKRYLSKSVKFLWSSTETFAWLAKFKITDEERDEILNFVESKCDANGFVSVKEIPLKNIAEENYEFSITAVYEAIYRLLLCELYVLNGVIITRKGAGTNAITLTKSFCLTKEEAEFSEICEYVESIIGESNKTLALKAAYESMVRVSKDKFVSDKNIHFEVDTIDSILDDQMKGEFISISGIVSLTLFPSCGYVWNHFLLGSYCYRFSKKYRTEMSSFNDRNVGLIVNRNCKLSYVEMLASVVAKSGIELTVGSVGQYMYENGYTALSQMNIFEEVTEKAIDLRRQGR